MGGGVAATQATPTWVELDIETHGLSGAHGMQVGIAHSMCQATGPYSR